MTLTALMYFACIFTVIRAAMNCSHLHLAMSELSNLSNAEQSDISDGDTEDSAEEIVYRHQDVLAWDQTEDEKVFRSMAHLLRSLQSGHQYLENALVFIEDSIQNQSCIIREICYRFRRIFYCNGSRIWMINFKSLHLKGHFDLSTVPSSARRLNLERNDFTSISDDK